MLEKLELILDVLKKGKPAWSNEDQFMGLYAISIIDGRDAISWETITDVINKLFDDKEATEVYDYLEEIRMRERPILPSFDEAPHWAKASRINFIEITIKSIYKNSIKKVFKLLDSRLSGTDTTLKYRLSIIKDNATVEELVNQILLTENFGHIIINDVRLEYDNHEIIAGDNIDNIKNAIVLDGTAHGEYNMLHYEIKIKNK